MTLDLVSDEEIARLTDVQRRDLIRRLQAAESHSQLPNPALGTSRSLHLTLLIVAGTALIPWTAYLAASLPVNQTAYNWDATWVGFDIILIVLLATTVTLALMRRRLVMATAYATAVVLVCDTWFDLMTSAPGDRMGPLAAAAFIELPIAAVLIRATLRVYRRDRTDPSLFTR
jgi:hypothetical protein